MQVLQSPSLEARRVRPGKAGQGGGAAANYLVFRAGPYDFALPSSCVVGMMSPIEIFPVASPPAGVVGFLAGPEAMLPVLDLARLLGVPASRSCRRAVWARLQPPDAEPLDAALLVERFAVSASMRDREIQPIGPRASLPFRHLVSGVWRGRSRPCYVLKPEALVPAADIARIRRWVFTLD